MKRVWRLAAPAALALSLSAPPAVATSRGAQPGPVQPNDAVSAVRGINVDGSRHDDSSDDRSAGTGEATAS